MGEDEFREKWVWPKPNSPHLSPMKSDAATPEAYLDSLPEDRKIAMQRLRQLFQDHLPQGFQETMSYGMIGYVVPHEIYPAGYHCTPELPLPFVSLASQKNFIALYHMGLYAQPELHDWFVAEYDRLVPTKLDMGKSCVRIKKLDQIPWSLLEELAGKMTPEVWIELYENKYRK
jgi:hypothetical protein